MRSFPFNSWNCLDRNVPGLWIRHFLECNGRGSGRGLGLVEVAPDGFGDFAGDDRGEGFSGGLLDVAETAEVGEKTLAGLRAYARDV